MNKDFKNGIIGLLMFMGIILLLGFVGTYGDDNTLLHGNMSKIFVLVMIVALTILEMYFWKKFSFVKFSIGLSMMNILILLLIGVVMYMKRGLSDDRNK